MRKLRLDPDSLRVETFRAEEHAVRMRGTVQGAQRTRPEPVLTMGVECDTGGYTVLTCPSGCTSCDPWTDTGGYTVITCPTGCTGCPPCGGPSEWNCATLDCTVAPAPPEAVADQRG